MQESYVYSDEEYKQKLNECINLLITAGYHKARIKSLDIFDRIVGGIIWCLSATDAELDTELLFLEDIHIKEKIQISEKVVKSLVKIQCPFPLEPHQIQGYDLFSIFPIIQWLVSKSESLKLKFEAIHKSCIIWQYERYFESPNKIKQWKSCYSNTPAIIQAFSNIPPSDKTSQLAQNILDSLTRESDLQQGKIIYTQNSNGTSQTLIKRPDTLVDIKTKVQNELKQISDKNAALMHEIQTNEDEIDNLDTTIQKLTQEISEMTDQYGQYLKNVEKYEQLKSIQKIKRNEYQKKIDDLQNKINSLQENLPNYSNDTELQKYLFWLKEDKDALILEVENGKGRIKSQTAQLEKLRLKLSDIPKREELNNYQKRLLELYNNANCLHSEVEQSYILYNSMNDIASILMKQNEFIESLDKSILPSKASLDDKSKFKESLNKILSSLTTSFDQIKTMHDQSFDEYCSMNSDLQTLMQKKENYDKLVKKLKRKIASISKLS